MHDDSVLEKELARAIEGRAERLHPPRREAVEHAISRGQRRRAGRFVGSTAMAGVLTVALAGGALLVLDGDGGSASNNAAAGGRSAGRIAYAKTVDGDIDLYVYDVSTGSESRLTSAAGNQVAPDWSPDGTSLVFQGFRESTGANDGLFVIDVETRETTELSSDISGLTPVWSPDGSKIAFANAVDGTVSVIDADGSDPVKLSEGPSDSGPQWSPDGSEIAFVRGGSLFLMDADGTDERPVTSGAQEGYPSWSPDGTAIAFTRQVDGNSDIFVVSSDGTGLRRLTDGPEHDSEPEWAPDGSKVLFIRIVDGEGVAYAVGPNGGETQRLGSIGGSVLSPDWTPTSS